jgi:proteasome accessory factor B
VSRKTERLVNLTIALLATKRYLTKSEIFRTVDGYEGNEDSKERMFERDKDDLRNLGIEIEVGSFDPLFEDEAGYRIKPESYQFQLGEVNAEEITLLSLAAEAWRGASLGSSALTALNKLHAIGIESDTELLLGLAPAFVMEDENLEIAISAITSRTALSFTYLNEELEPQSRALEPFAVTSRYGHWYILGRDLDRDALRIFRLDRISGVLKVQGRPGSYEIPKDIDVSGAFSSSTDLRTAQIFLRDGRGLNLRNRANPLVDNETPIGWQKFEISYRDHQRFVEEVLWYGDDVVVETPRELRDEIIGHLKSGVASYG